MDESLDKETYEKNRDKLILHLQILNKLIASGKVTLTNDDEIINNLNSLSKNEQNGNNDLGLVEICDNLIWTEDVIFNHELEVLEKRMAFRNITPYLPAYLSSNESKVVKNSFNRVATASRQKNIDKALLIETVQAINGYLDSPNDENKLQALNTSINKLPKESEVVFYLKALLVTATCFAILTVALTLGVHFGLLDLNSLIAPLNILKDIGIAIFKFAQGSAFPLPKILGGDTVPIWSLTIGFLGGALVGLLGVQTVKTMVANKTNVADKSVAKNSIYNGQLRRQEILESCFAFVAIENKKENEILDNIRNNPDKYITKKPVSNRPDRSVPPPPSNAKNIETITDLQKKLEEHNNSNSNNPSNQC